MKLPTDITWTTEPRRLGDLKPWEKNPRQLSKKDAAQIEKSMAKFGLADPLVINLDNSLIGGHQRKNVLGNPDQIVDCRIPSRQLTVEEAEELAIRLNRNSGDWDWDALVNWFEPDLLQDWGFDAEELVKGGFDLDGDKADDPGAQIDRAEELREKWGVELGQLWQLGDHRMICGDCTDRAVVERVMGGEKARLVFTSPPYADQREYTIGSFDWLALANGMFDALPIGDPCDIVINLGLSYKDGKVNQYWQPWIEHCDTKGFPLYGWYVWDKGSGVPGDWGGRLATSHEFIFHFCGGKGQINQWIPKADSTFQRNMYSTQGKQRGADGKIKPVSSPRSQWNYNKIPDSVIAIRRDSEGYGDHPAVFPVELPEFILQTWSDAESIVYEPFSGSGTTLVACERLSRKCRAVEISPAYCAVAIQRWVDMTGGEPVILEDVLT